MIDNFYINLIGVGTMAIGTTLTALIAMRGRDPHYNQHDMSFLKRPTAAELAAKRKADLMKRKGNLNNEVKRVNIGDIKDDRTVQMKKCGHCGLYHNPKLSCAVAKAQMRSR
jgi:hypothetical protein